MRGRGNKILVIGMLGLFLIGTGCTFEKPGGDTPAAVQPSGEVVKEEKAAPSGEQAAPAAAAEPSEPAAPAAE